MKRNVLSLLLVFCTLSLLTLPACAASPAAVTPDAGPFADVAADAWYAEAVEFCTRQGIMGGTDETTFSPGAPMTRAMLAAVLYRMAGSPVPAGSADFTDIGAGDWYARAAAWAAEAGVLSGYGNGRFGGGEPVTREQMAAVLWRYAGAPAADPAEAFSDRAALSDWAGPAVDWARNGGILSGKEGNRFDPKAEVTRAETAAILYRYLQRNPAAPAAPSGETLVISVNGRDFTAALEDNASARALAERLPMTISMEEHNGNEKYFNLAQDLPSAPERPGSIQAGDLMLYGPDGLVLFYEDLDSTYAYTRLGRIADPEGLAEALGGGRVTVTFQLRAGEASRDDAAGNRILVAYFSATGTTEALAEQAADILDADLYEIVPEIPYTADDLNYNHSSSRANREQDDPTARPAISGSAADIKDYNVVLLGYPIWHGQAPKIVYTFLESYDFSGKTIVPFCTSHSSGIGSSDRDLHALASGADWRSGTRFAKGTTRETMEEWIGGLGLHTDTLAAFDFETKTVTLNSGCEMPLGGLGTYSLTGETCVDAVSAALARGVRLIDTAYMYHNEAEVGRAVRESGIPREEIFVITKLYPSQFADAEAAIDAALETLDIGYIDLMLLHHPGAGDVSAYKAMERAVEAGKLRSIGLSNWYVEELEAFLPQVTITPALVQNEIHPYYQENDVIPYIQSRGITVQGWYPLGGRGHTAELLGDPVISGIAAAHGKSAAQVILRWNLQKGVVVIPGSSNPAHIQENTELYDFALTDEEMARINALDRGEKHDWY